METAANNTANVSQLPPQKSQPKTLRKSALAEMFDVSAKTIGRHVDSGLLPQPDFYVGRFPHWKPSSIDNWIQTRKKI